MGRKRKERKKRNMKKIKWMAGEEEKLAENGKGEMNVAKERKGEIGKRENER